MDRQLIIPFETDDRSTKTSGAEVAPDRKREYLQRFCARASVTPFIETYNPSRRTKQYFRISWREGKKMRHEHIPGGNINAPLAQYRAKKLQTMCDRGAELAEIIAAVETYRGIKR